MKCETLFKSANTLGESPFWHSERQSVFWVDIARSELNEMSWVTEQVHIWQLEQQASLIIDASNNQLTLAVKGGIINFNLTTGSSEWLMQIDGEVSNMRCNDGGVDADGRIWVGVMDDHCKASQGSLYRVTSFDLPPERVLEALTIPNGLVWSLDNQRMYFIDTITRKVKSYIFDRSTGTILYEKDAIVIPEYMGMPDGVTIDQDGMLWVALYGGFGVGRWNPLTGNLIAMITLPAPNITNCCFAGEQLDELVITSARENLTDEQMRQYPESGNLFILKEPGVRGIKPFELRTS